MTDARLLLTCGLPGAGKTTRARELARDRNAVRLTKDDWMWALGSTPWDDELRPLVEAQLWQLARDLLRAGTGVVLDFGFWARSERDELRRAAREVGVGVELHYLAASVDELWRRVEARNAEPPWNRCPISRATFDEWAEAFEAPDVDELTLFDDPPDAA